MSQEKMVTALHRSRKQESANHMQKCVKSEFGFSVKGAEPNKSRLIEDFFGALDQLVYAKGWEAKTLEQLTAGVKKS
jgi:hypothetical protein